MSYFQFIGGRFFALRLAGCGSKRWIPTVARFHLDDARAAIFSTKHDHHEKSTWLWHSKELDGSASRASLLHQGKARVFVDAEYTDIPKILRGYYKKVNGRVTENLERSRSDTIRAGNVWVDIQQVFYRMGENVSGCYAQKPIKCIDRNIRASSSPGDLVIDFFAHSGTTLIAADLLGRKCYTLDVDPIYAEITIRRLERMRATKQTGWQNGHPFENDAPDLVRVPEAGG